MLSCNFWLFSWIFWNLLTWSWHFWPNATGFLWNIFHHEISKCPPRFWQKFKQSLFHFKRLCVTACSPILFIILSDSPGLLLSNCAQYLSKTYFFSAMKQSAMIPLGHHFGFLLSTLSLWKCYAQNYHQVCKS